MLLVNQRDGMNRFKFRRRFETCILLMWMWLAFL